jgi:hypothetical protein
MNQAYGRNYIYLTNISLYLTVTTLAIGLCVRYFKTKRFISLYVNLVSVGLPLSLLVTVLFWGLFLIDPTLVRNKELHDKGVRVNLLSDLCMHFFPFLALLFEQYDVKLKRETSHVIFYFIFCPSYFFITSLFAKANGFWVYPILDQLSFFGKCMLFGCSNILVWLFYEGLMLLFSKKSFFVISKSVKPQLK